MSAEVQRFQKALMANGGLAGSLVTEAGVSLGPEEDRRGSAIASCYSLGAHTVIFCDPDLMPQLQSFVDAHPAADRATWLAWAVGEGASHLGSGVMRVRETGQSADQPANSSVAALSANEPADVARIHAFLDVCDEDDIDEADIDRDNLDPVIHCAIGQDNEVQAFASALPWDSLPAWWDIGVLTSETHRKRGLGAQAALAASLGFVIATELDAVRFGSS